MVTDAKGVRPLFPGARLRRDEFLRRCEAMPEVKKAELIGELVYMQGAVIVQHGEAHADVCGWMHRYSVCIPGCEDLVDAGGRSAARRAFVDPS